MDEWYPFIKRNTRKIKDTLLRWYIITITYWRSSFYLLPKGYMVETGVHNRIMNDPKHTSRVAKTFIDEKRIHVMDWPSILTPLLKMCVISWKIMLKNKCQWIKEIYGWGIPQETVKNINMSMKRWCELILEKNGDRISY